MTADLLRMAMTAEHPSLALMVKATTKMELRMVADPLLLKPLPRFVQ